MRFIFNMTQVSDVIICDQTYKCIWTKQIMIINWMHLQNQLGLCWLSSPVEYLLLYSLCTFLSLEVWELPQCPNNNSAGGFGQISSGEGGVSDKKRRETCLPVFCSAAKKKKAGKESMYTLCSFCVGVFIVF